MERLCQIEYTTDERGVKSASRCVPYTGVTLFEIKATYAKSVPSSTYYYLGRTKKDATSRFMSVMGRYMTITSLREIPPGDEAESILTDMYRMPFR